MTDSVPPQETVRAAAEAVRAACLRAALDGYERAGFGGMCEEGRWEMVVDSIKALDIDAIVRGLDSHGGTSAGRAPER